jgi:PKD repeat protein
MKVFSIVFFMLFISFLHTVSFQYQYDLPRFDPADEIKQIVLFDIDDNGLDEICVAYDSNGLFRLVIYDQTGSILDVYDYPQNANYVYDKFHFLRIDNILYLIFVINRNEINGNQISKYCTLQAINWQTGLLVDEHSILVGEYNNNGFSSYDFSTHVIKDKIYNPHTYLFLGISRHYSWGDMWSGGSSYVSILYKFIFNGSSFSLLENFENCGSSISFLDDEMNIYTTGYHSSSSYDDMSYAGNKTYCIKKMNYYTPALEDTIWTSSGYHSSGMSGNIYNHYPSGFRLLKQYSDPISNQYPFYFFVSDNDGNYDVFNSFDPNSNTLQWTSSYSELREFGFYMRASSLINTVQGDNFILYFGEKGNPVEYCLEIRNLLTGDFAITEEAPFVPYKITRNESNINLYFVQTSLGCDVYTLDSVVVPDVIARFSCSDTISFSPVAVNFSEYSYGNVTSWEWDFDNDGIIDSNEQNPDWTYYQAGYHSVSLTVSNGTISNTITKENLIHVLAPQASFSFDLENGVVPLTVSFTDESIENLDSWEWDFNNDEIADSYEQNPSWEYDDIGIFTISLTVSDGTNTDTIIIEDCIEVYPFILEFDSNTHVGWIPLPVQFEDLSEGTLDSWEWDFNEDGIMDSNEQNPDWTYNEIGWYDVSLTVENEFGTETLTKQNFIHTLFVQTGSIYEDTTWDVDTVSVMGSITIEEDVTLIISEGVTILLPISCTIDIRGNIIAEGTENDSIYFKPYYTIPWKSIIFEETPEDADSSLFSFCSFQNSQGIPHTSQPVTKGGAFYFEDFSKVKISNSTFINNYADEGGCIYLSMASPIIENCTFYNNEAEKGAAIYSYGSLALINNCKIISNSSEFGAVYFKYSRNPILNTVFANNLSDYGGAIYCYHLDPPITNCVFWGNDAVYYNQGASIFLEEASPIIQNSIFWHASSGNYTDQIYLDDGNCLPEIRFCNLQEYEGSLGGIGYIHYPDSLFTDNIDVNPLFVDPTTLNGLTNTVLDANWMLSATSPCIDAGNPDLIFNDIEDPLNPGYALFPALGSITNDMGAYGGPNSSTWSFTDINPYEIPTVFVKNEITNFPNPFNPTTTFAFSSEFINQDVNVKIYNVKGQIVKELQPDFSVNIIVWDGNDSRGKPVSSGVYYYTLLVDREIIASKKCLLLK